MFAVDHGRAISAMAAHWRSPAKHTHIAVEDAIKQGQLLINILREFNAQCGDITPPFSHKTARRRRLEQHQSHGRSR